MYTIHSILLPTDFSEYSDHALAVAGSLARDHGARLVLLHVVEGEIVAGESGIWLPPAQGTLEEARERLETLPVPDPSLPVEHRVASGFPVDEILRLAEKEPFDLIVMGTHGRTGLSRLLMGSVAEQVLRRAQCPVLTVRGATVEAVATAGRPDVTSWGAE